MILIASLTLAFALIGACLLLLGKQGDTVTVSLVAQKAGLTAVKTVVSYEYKLFDFDMEASKKASPNVTFVDNKAEGIAIRYAGSGTKENSVPIKMFFTAKRTGDKAVLSDITPFKMLELDASTVANATDAQLLPDRADGMATVTVGFNTLLYKIIYNFSRKITLPFFRQGFAFL